jgi:hypothetical protein
LELNSSKSFDDPHRSVTPDNHISEDQVLSRGTRHVVNRAATALRIAATTLLRSPTYLGAVPTFAQWRALAYLLPKKATRSTPLRRL